MSSRAEVREMEMPTLDKLPPDLLARFDVETVFEASRCAIAAGRLHLFRDH